MVYSQSNPNTALFDWWQQVHPIAVSLEKQITTAPTERPTEAVDDAQHILPELHASLAQIENAPDTASMHDHLERAITYLIHAYQQLAQGRADEVEFYYASALTQLAKLHYQLVQHGFTEA
ncbi:MAG: hypothetical protein ACFE0Q_20330 [Anaerolineae bacterium]